MPKRCKTKRNYRHHLRNCAGAYLSKPSEGYTSRIGRCGKGRLSNVEVWNTPGQDTAHFRGVISCGSIWLCPVCAAKISEGRRQELREVMDGHAAEGGAAYQVTLTMPHTRFDGCKDLRDAVAHGWQLAQGTRAWSRAKKEFGVMGQVRTLEITHGQRGWHPHLHLLVFTDRHLGADDQETFQTVMFEEWAKRVEQLTGKKCNRSAFDWRPATAGDYLTKWGADAEITKAIDKQGRGASRSPWELLSDAADGDQQARMLWLDYAEAFKGARHMTWSRGFKDRYLRSDRTDEDLSRTMPETGDNTPDEPVRHPPQMAARFDGATWNAVVRLGLTADILDAAAIAGFDGVKAVLAEHRIPAATLERPPAWMGRREYA